MPKIALEKLTLRNFLSFGDRPQEFVFPGPGIYRIYGKNDDTPVTSMGVTDPNVTSSGSGKSSLIAGLVFAIQGDTPRKVGKNRVINKKYKKNMHLSLQFTRDGERYRIDRYRKHNKYANSLKLHKEENGNWNDVSLEDLRLTQDHIDRLFGVNFDVLMKTLVIARDGSRNFLDMPPHERMSVIENIIQIDKLKEYALRIKEKLRETRKELEHINLQLSESIGGSKTLVSLIKQEISNKRKKEKAILQRIDQSTREVEEMGASGLTAEIVEDRKRIFVAAESLKRAQKEVESARQEHGAAGAIISMYKVNRHAAESSRSDVAHIMQHHGHTCSQCGFELDQEKRQKKIAAAETSLEKARKSMSDLRKKFKKAAEEVRQIVARCDEAHYEFGVIMLDFKNKHGMTVEQFDDLSHLVEHAEKSRSEIAELRKELTIIKSIDNVLSMRKKLNEKRSAIKKILFQKEIKEKHLRIGEFWDAAFDFRNEGSIKSYILNKIVPVFNNVLSSFVAVMFNGQMSVHFDSTFQETIVYSGEEFDYDQLSTGEKARLSLCIAFTVFNMTKMNLVSMSAMFIDESFAGMDSETIRKFVEIIRQWYSKEIGVFVVSYESGVDMHLDPDASFTVRKSNGESYID